MAVSLRIDNQRMLLKLAVVAGLMFGFGYALVPMYKAICELTGINILALGEKELPGSGNARLAKPENTVAFADLRAEQQCWPQTDPGA